VLDPLYGEVRMARSELTLRLTTAGLSIPPVLALCFLGGPLFVAGLSVVAGIAAAEFQGLLRAKGIAVYPALAVAGAGLLPWVVYVGGPVYVHGFLTAVLGLALGRQLLAGTQGALAGAAALFFTISYAGWMLSYGVSLRFLPSALPELGLAPRSGFFFVCLALLSAVGSDAGGYFIGRAFGRRPLAPRISPSKTLEGACGALIGGTALGLLGFALFRAVPGALTGGLSVLCAAGACLLIAAVAIVGDLVESVFKRDAERKDAGQLLPGIGGILDRVDSLLLAFPLLYFWLLGYYAGAR